MWSMFFDEDPLEEGLGEGIVLVSPLGENLSLSLSLSLSHKLEFYNTNIVTVYQALVLGMEAMRRMRIRNITSFGDSDLVVNKK